MKVYQEENFIVAVGAAFQLLLIQDLCLWCGEIPDFMKKVVCIWAPSLRHLLKLRIKFDRDFDTKVSIRMLVLFRG